ncbi:N-terminal EF-hand calcium-binding protein 1 [Collichthys lucidus]|uniref:N-terminal EF-hand calcium-binding protein 1 n=1 Tax=Collichthys lucidus TaxID=240159 RepID=A0A4U5URC7_COLLU|nr:N-terminal EF-hand calcium-binding protein 1 [Collichthys lucidus]
MCLQSAKHEHLRKQQELDHNQNQGISLVQDIFRRADKNDDGKLSLEEFQSYFTDGILTDEQMQELYYSIDRQQTDNLDIDKLSEYFTPHLGEYVSVLSALEKLNVAILKAMDKTKEEYQGSSVLGQFVTRFLLRETSTQLQSLQSSLDCAMEAVHDQGCTGRRIVKKPEELPIQRVAKRPGRRIQKNMCLSPTDPYSGMLTTGVSVESDNHWDTQINQLEQLMDKLECESPHLEPLKEDTLAGTYKSNILLVQRQMSVKERDVEQFQQALKIYTDATCSQLNNLHYLQSSISKTFQRCIIDSLEEPEMVSTMLLPVTVGLLQGYLGQNNCQICGLVLYATCACISSSHCVDSLARKKKKTLDQPKSSEEVQEDVELKRLTVKDYMKTEVKYNRKQHGSNEEMSGGAVK